MLVDEISKRNGGFRNARRDNHLCRPLRQVERGAAGILLKEAGDDIQRVHRERHSIKLCT